MQSQSKVKLPCMAGRTPLVVGMTLLDYTTVIGDPALSAEGTVKTLIVFYTVEPLSEMIKGKHPGVYLLSSPKNPVRRDKTEFGS